GGKAGAGGGGGGDMNDRIAQQLRRDLRGQYPVFAWVGYADLPTTNFLDVLVSDRNDPATHYVEHRLIDFDSSLGAINDVKYDVRQNYLYEFDPGDLFTQLITLGMWPEPWRGKKAPPLRRAGSRCAA